MVIRDEYEKINKNISIIANCQYLADMAIVSNSTA